MDAKELTVGTRVGLCILITALTFASSGCSTHSYPGINLRHEQAFGPMQHLAIRARAGDKKAQLALGILYEEGIDVPLDLRLAERLYKSAAEGTAVLIYSPPIGKEGSGTLLRVGEDGSGLDEAKQRLRNIQLKIARKDREIR